jgi:hypothetical protein
LSLELQNFSGNNLLGVSSFVVNGNTISMVSYETLVLNNFQFAILNFMHFVIKNGNLVSI